MSVRLLSKRFPAIRRGFGKPIGKLEDTSGSSVVLALAFFLICAIVGSIILTAASVNAKTVATYKETQQAEYTVTSAAGLWAD